MSTREVVAANVRARLAWTRGNHAWLRQEMGWSQRTVQNKLAGVTPITAEELAALAGLFGLDDPGLLYRVPDGFTAVTAPSRCIGVPSGHSLWLAA